MDLILGSQHAKVDLGVVVKIPCAHDAFSIGYGLQ